MIPLYLLLGVALGLLFCVFAHARTDTNNALSAGLLGASVIYVVFAFFYGAEGWIGVESTGVMISYFFVLMARKFGVVTLGVGWLVHPLWDYFVHLVGPGREFAPLWYVYLCISFDLVVALYAFYRAYAAPRRRTPKPRR